VIVDRSNNLHVEIKGNAPSLAPLSSHAHTPNCVRGYWRLAPSSPGRIDKLFTRFRSLANQDLDLNQKVRGNWYKILGCEIFWHRDLKSGSHAPEVRNMGSPGCNPGFMNAGPFENPRQGIKSTDGKLSKGNYAGHQMNAAWLAKWTHVIMCSANLSHTSRQTRRAAHSLLYFFYL